MADSDPISEATPNKRRKLQHNSSRAQGWDSDEEFGNEITAEDLAEFESTQPTLPVAHSLKPQGRSRTVNGYFSSQTGLGVGRDSSQTAAIVTQPTQTYSSSLHVTQPTQRLPTSAPNTSQSDVQVPRSSPPISPHAPPSIKRAPFAKPAGRGGLLARSIGPAGTSFRPPLGISAKPAAKVIHIDDSEEEPDPPVMLSDDDETQTQGARSNIRPTAFTSGDHSFRNSVRQELPSRNTVIETPQKSGSRNASATGGSTTFGDLMASFTHQPNSASASSRQGDDMANAYAGQSRRPKPQTSPARAQPVTPVRFQSFEDIEDEKLRRGVLAIRKVLPYHSIDTMYKYLVQCHGNIDDAMNAIVAADERREAEIDELSSLTPAAKRGQAIHTTQTSKAFSEITRRNAKQEVKAPLRSIAEKYGQSQQNRKPSVSQAAKLPDSDVGSDEDVPSRKGRMLNGHRSRHSPSPASSPVKQPRRLTQGRPVITIDDDDDDDDDDEEHNAGQSPIEIDASDDDGAQIDNFDFRLLKFLNTCSSQELADLCAQPEEVTRFVLDQRPFANLDAVREISNVTETKSGRKSKTRPIGDKIVDISSEMLKGYEAVDELVEQCDKIAQPIQQALKGWGVGDSADGELHMMNLEEAHDSGIGTPASSCNGDGGSKGSASRKKFLTQPENMGDVTMKDYQLVGLNWLNLLWSKKISCILADDMGLGKTCQVIAFLAHLQMQKVDGVHLVIVPGSTLENWLREFARFAPSLNVTPYYGSQKERPELQIQIEEQFSDLDVIVTTYDMAAKPDDNRFLRKLGPCVCVFDEAHSLRNPGSDRYTQLMRIPSDFRLLLTGTPLQNNLQELIAILAFIMPDLFRGKREDLDYIFKHKATTKESDHTALLSADRIARARTMMTPFILRRKKAQVLDLPAKHSRVEWCDMTSTQSAYYSQLVNEAQQLFSENTGPTTKAKAAKASSNILMALRKAAIQPLLSRRIYNDDKINKIVNELSKHEEFGGNPPDKIKAYLTGEGPQSLKPGDFSLHTFCTERDYLHKYTLKKQPWMDSGKVQKFKELVSEYHQNGDRLLVFSQFTTMMDILEAVLETLSIKFMRLDGSTRMDLRQDMIDQFMTDDNITVFMLSTKAGGAGINLTCANKVIIFDAGFNPQDDIQAENRAHRVGQTREVEVVRLVTRGTIEEQIHALGESKLALDERVAGEGATAAEDKQAEKTGEQMVEKLFKQRIAGHGDDSLATTVVAPGGDLKDAFKAGLEGAGVRVRSKQAQF